ncbi:hypothetical protein ASPBRDRAFT_72837 [Aspergillus brasiliensis CBS 101740]|uniref:Uncharacterized protein n=1 Tax=Aspergillus brasiliensis (strain CBS 101740 / IMI 381727 / IBT 21946) TaxID=767769 RepID=A0A1L9US88_ASPBC|nr:hypothetical protein ASPBRDRAFT_72837 [Aspergillus brasiliensis CBS 101740]
MASETTHLQEEDVAHVVWAAHILAYLTRGRSHAQAQQSGDAAASDTDSETEAEAAVEETDTATENAAALFTSRESVWRKFLDCVCQLLSPCKGWDGVTAATIREEEGSIIIDVARNGGFDSDPTTLEYCRMLESYLACCASAKEPSPTAKFITDFETASINYTSSRVDYWIAACQKAYTGSHVDTDWDSKVWPGRESAVQTWIIMAALLLRFDSERMDSNTRSCLVQQAYRCVRETEAQQLLLDALGPKPGLRLWVCLRFVARPLTDCRLLREIALWEPQLRHAQVSLVPSTPKTTLGRDFVVDIVTAWERLGLGIAAKSVIDLLDPYKERFKQACAEPFSLHAEMQLISHYEECRGARRMLDYIGCSKKSCLLCEMFLAALNNPIETRGRHGVCYPAWGVPCSNSEAIHLATHRLTNNLVTRIRGFSREWIQPGATAALPNVMQSGIVSDFSGPTLEDWRQRQKDVDTAKAEQSTIRTKLLLTQRFSFPQAACKKFATQPGRPSPEHKRAIFFPAHKAKPVLVWIPTKRQYDKESGERWTEALVHPYLGPDSPITGRLRVERNEVRGRNLGSGFVAWASRKEGYCVHLLHRDAYLVDGSLPNQSILASVRASSAASCPHAYHGPMIAIREIHPEDYADIELADFRHMMDYFYRAPTVIRGVKICCDGEIKLHGSKPFVSIDIKQSTRLTLLAEEGISISPISALLGVPLIFWKDPNAEFHDNPPGWDATLTASSNENAAFMMRDTNPSDSSWGWASLHWNLDIGNVWVVREDEQDLDVREVAMMCYFARHKLQRIFADTMDTEGCNMQDRQRVLSFITRENMRAYWEDTGGDEAVRKHEAVCS